MSADLKTELCPLCGGWVSPGQAAEIVVAMEADARTCPECCRTYGEARREIAEHEVSP